MGIEHKKKMKSEACTTHINSAIGQVFIIDCELSSKSFPNSFTANKLVRILYYGMGHWIQILHLWFGLTSTIIKLYVNVVY